MSKEKIAKVLEDFLGEYILNISKENLKVGVIRGKVKLDNVQLDGDLIGNHILSAVGLSGFGVLSCWAHKLRLSVPWSALEKEPTRIEIRGMHLLCVPLVFSTAMMEMGSGTFLDPRCTLRTRSKQSSIARFERNFFAGRIINEGPLSVNIENFQCKKSDFHESESFGKGDKDTPKHFEKESTSFDSNLEGTKDMAVKMAKNDPKGQNWMGRLKAKMLKNVEASIRDLHVRCEVPTNAVDDIKITDHQQHNNDQPAGRAFSFGFTLESFIVKTMDPDDTNCVKKEDDDSVKKTSFEVAATKEEGKKRFVEINSMAMYWDEYSPFLICDSILSEENNKKFTPNDIQKSISQAMDAMMYSQDPGEAFHKFFQNLRNETRATLHHQYICDPFSLKFCILLEEDTAENLASVLVDLLPCNLHFRFKPQQCRQYFLLKTAMIAQQRVDTMLHQRPGERPLKDRKYCRAWWRYVIACVITRPNARPWRDVQRIVRARPRYIALVLKKKISSQNGNGNNVEFSQEESAELVALQSLLPIEALLSFHLVALREIVAGQVSEQTRQEAARILNSRSPGRLPSLGRIRRALGGMNNKGRRVIGNTDMDEFPMLGPLEMDIEDGNLTLEKSCVNSQKNSDKSKAQYEKKMFKVHLVNITCTLLDKTFGEPIVKFELKTSGLIRSNMSLQNDLLFNIQKFDVVDCLDPIVQDRSQISKILCVTPISSSRKTSSNHVEDNDDVEAIDDEILDIFFQETLKIMSNEEKASGNPELKDEGYSPFPPPGVLFRVLASSSPNTDFLKISAHPANIIYKKSCVDAILNFFSNASPKTQTILSSQLRNSATPLAYKAQLALMSPKPVFLDVHINAPKLWFPVSAKDTDGALFLDAGKIKIKMAKKEGLADTKWEAYLNETQMNFCGIMPKTPHDLNSEIRIHRKELDIPILSPFNMKILANTIETPMKNRNIFRDNQGHENMSQSMHAMKISQMNVIIGKLCLDLVEVEVLAKAIGRWYAAELARRANRNATFEERLKKSSSMEVGTKQVAMPKSRGERTASNRMSLQMLHVASFQIFINIEQIQLSLDSSGSDVEARLSRSKGKNHSRIYDFNVSGIYVQFGREDHLTISRLNLDDVYIVQRKSNSEKYTPQTPTKSGSRNVGINSRHFILVRAYENGRESEQMCNLTSDLLLYDLPRVTTYVEQNDSFGILTSPATDGRNVGLFLPSDSHGFVTQKRRNLLLACYLRDSSKHHDEVEIDVDAIILRVTPTTLRDCLFSLRRVFVLMQIMTREMERRIHKEGRIARNLHEKNLKHLPKNVEENASDSSILFKVVLKQMTLLVGKTVTEADSISKSKGSPHHKKNQKVSNETVQKATVLQMLSNVLVMFQSTEDAFGRGTKTMHVSVENLSAALNTNFESISLADTTPILSPTSAEIRIFYMTENQGSIVSQECSIDCDTLKCCVTPEDLKTLTGITRKMKERLHNLNDASLKEKGQVDDSIKTLNQHKESLNSFTTPLFQYRKKGSGIATRLRLELQSLSVVLLRAQHFKNAGRPLFDLNLNHIKGKFEGCLSAMSGECNAYVSVNFFNTWISEWEYIVEPTLLVIAIDQMPNEFSFNVASPDPINTNLTGVLLSDLAEMDFDFLRVRRKAKQSQTHAITKISQSSAQLVTIMNESGLDIVVCNVGSVDQDMTSSDICLLSDALHVSNGSSASLDYCLGGDELQKLSNYVSNAYPKLSLALEESARNQIGEREPLMNLPITTSQGHSVTTHSLKPATSREKCQKSNAQRQRGEPTSSWSPVTVFSENSVHDQGTTNNFLFEPVVEWCIQNQRLRASTVDISSIEKGKDLLSSQMWSPGDEFYLDLGQTTNLSNIGNSNGLLNTLKDSFDSDENISGHTMSSTRSAINGHWLRPYLENDAPEWTDMTYILRLYRERVMLPDPNWIWANDWEVDRSGILGVTTDGDGWEYSTDFSQFNRSRRHYKKGDSCRRRRWTRTRIVKPPPLNHPTSPLSLVWESKRKEDGSILLEVRSPLIIHNCTSIELSFFAFSYSWNKDEYIVSIKGGDNKAVPIPFSKATYMRIAFPKSKSHHSSNANLSQSMSDYFISERVMILPSSLNSMGLLRTTIKASGVGKIKNHLKFLVQIKSDRSMTSIFIEPVLRIINLLPCVISCKLGEAIRDTQHTGKQNALRNRRKDIMEQEEIVVNVGEDAKVLSVDPSMKPHLSIRLPAYQWSPWHRIVNVDLRAESWVPNEEEEINLFHSNEGDVEHAAEYKNVIHLERMYNGGDPLVIVLSVECGHCPILRLWAQYWIIDKTSFGLRFADSFTGILGQSPAAESSRKSYLTPVEAEDKRIIDDLNILGHQWSVGMSGMSLYFSKKQRISLRIETGAGDNLHQNNQNGKNDIQIKSSWSSSMDISNVMPKTVFSLEEYGGPRRFELSLNVTLCPSVFSRTKLITIFPRYQIVNLLSEVLFVAQDGCLDSDTAIPSQTSVPFHWDVSSLSPKVRLSVASDNNSDGIKNMWTNGCIRLDKVGITSMRLPTRNSKTFKPMVIQAEVRLATPQQSSAVVIVVWCTHESSNPLYVLKNTSSYTIFCSQLRKDDRPSIEESADESDLAYESWKSKGEGSKIAGQFDAIKDSLQCHSYSFDGSKYSAYQMEQLQCTSLSPLIGNYFETNKDQEFIWRLPRGEVMCFGFDDPEKPHVLKWTCLDVNNLAFSQENPILSVLDMDAMGSTSLLTLVDGTQVQCQIQAEHSTKVIEFSNIIQDNSPNLRHSIIQELQINSDELIKKEKLPEDNELDDDFISLKCRIDLPRIAISVVDNVSEAISGREILYLQTDSWMFEFSQSREGYHEIEIMLMSLQIDNHVSQTAHPVLLFCPRIDKREPFLHMSAVRRLHLLSSTFVFRYAALRLLELDIFLDRRTAETIGQFFDPLNKVREEEKYDNAQEWVTAMTSRMSSKYAKPNRRAPRDIEKMAHTANAGRIYFEQLHLHPIRLSLTFTQEWTEWNPATEGMMIFQFIRGMASIAGAPLTFTSFVVSHAFEAPQAFLRIILAHYSSQLTKQIFGILGSLAILGAPADFLTNVGTGVRDFFYEPINGIIHGPQQFIEGLEAGTQSLARGLVVGVVRGAANVTDVVNSNLAGLTADDEFIDEREAHRRMLTDALSRGTAYRTIGDSLYLAGASVVRGVKSGAMGIVEQPSRYASRHGPYGLIKGVGKALVGAIVKPVVGVGDAAVLMMNHVSENTSDKDILLKIPKRLRRALPRISVDRGQTVQLVPYDDKAAKAQKIVTAGESVDDIYIGHINTATHLIIASEQCLWAIDRESRKPWCLSWEEVSHFTMLENRVMRIAVFSKTGLKPYSFKVESAKHFAELYQLLSMQISRMGNCVTNFSDLDKIMFGGGLEDMSNNPLPGIKSKQINHLFGSVNTRKTTISISQRDDIGVIEECYGRVQKLGSDIPVFFKSLDEEAWNLVSAWGQLYSGLNSKRCLAVGLINGSGYDIQVKSTMLIEGGSPCYAIPSCEFDQEQGVLYPGGAIIFFGWGAVPNLTQLGRVFMCIETSAFVCHLSDRKSSAAYTESLPGFAVGFLEKSYDDNGWWAKYWLLVRRS